jgi:phenylacetate-CoA ligase
MNPAALSDILGSLGRRRPQLARSILGVLPLDLLRAMRRPGLKATLAAASRLPFYQEAFARAGIDPAAVKQPEDMGDFFLTPEILKQQPELLVSESPDLAIESSGTSGHISKVFLSRQELEYNARQGVLLYALYGLDPRDRLLCTFDLGFGLGALLVQNWVRYLKIFAMIVGRVDPMEAYRRLAAYRFNVIVSDPFYLARLTEIAREHGRPGPLKLMMGGGEGVTNQLREELESFWDAPLYMTYASTEAATVLGWECPLQNGYHVNEFDFYVEIDGADTDGHGEMVITSVNRRVMPLIRYRTGDVARWLPGNCACRLPFRRISPICRRVDEQISCAWGNVHADFFEKILRSVDGIADDWQVALLERKGRQTFEFRLELKNGDLPGHHFKQQMVDSIQREHPQAWQACLQKLTDVDFVFYRKGMLRKSRKLLRLVDERRPADSAASL